MSETSGRRPHPAGVAGIRRVWALLGVLLLAGCLARPEIPAASGEVVHLSDVHFNPFADPALVPALIAAGEAQWPAIFDRSTETGVGSYGGDGETSFRLLRAALRDASLRQPRPDFVLFTGDIVAHNFAARYRKVRPEATPGELEAFIAKTVAYVSHALADAFPQAPVYFALGNNDSYCGDYWLAPGGAFLRNTAPLFGHTLLRDTLGAAELAADYAAGGYYSATPPMVKGARIVALDTVLFSAKYRLPEKESFPGHCGPTLGYSAQQRQLRWLEAQLGEAETRLEKVWLLLHIPPGIDVYSTLVGGTTADGALKKVTSFWKPEYQKPFLELLAAHRSSIRAVFAGHTHMEDFRLVGDQAGGGQGPFVRISPAVSPQFGNNPGYSILRYDPADFSLRNYRSFYLDLDAPRVSETTPWREDYAFDATYGGLAITPAAYAEARRRIASDDEVRSHWMRYYNVSHTSKPGINARDWRAYWCGEGELEAAAFGDCMAGK